MSQPLNVKAEVERLIADMFATIAAGADVETVRETIEVATIARQMALPVIAGDTPPSFIPAMARATLLGAWVQHDRNQALDKMANVAA